MNNSHISDEQRALKRVCVRLLQDNERERFDRLLENKHYLASARIGGRSLRYVAELDGEWVALLCFSGAAMHLKPREKWIGWSARQRARRLDFVVNNSRYLLLVDRCKLPNLASRILGMCLRRLSRDWLSRWDQPVLAVESFVDQTRFEGTCYRACGFEEVGLSAGFARNHRDFYHEHGQPKQLFIRELDKKARRLLRQSRLPRELAQYEQQTAGPCPFRAPELNALFKRFKTLKDRRSQGHGRRHSQPFVLACASVAVVMGAGGYKAIEDICKRFTQRQLKALGCLPDRKGQYVAPSDSTLYRVLSKVDVKALDQIIGEWLLEQSIADVARLAVDGKVLRGSRRENGRPLQLLSAVTHRLKLTLVQEAIRIKSNEITAYPKLLERLPRVERLLITADAIQCQQKGAQLTTQEYGYDYLFGLKGNQSGILELAEFLLSKQAFSP